MWMEARCVCDTTGLFRSKKIAIMNVSSAASAARANSGGVLIRPAGPFKPIVRGTEHSQSPAKGYPLYGFLAERKKEKRRKHLLRLRNAADTRPMMIYLVITASAFMKLGYAPPVARHESNCLIPNSTMHRRLRGVDEWMSKLANQRLRTRQDVTNKFILLPPHFISPTATTNYFTLVTYLTSHWEHGFVNTPHVGINNVAVLCHHITPLSYLADMVENSYGLYTCVLPLPSQHQHNPGERTDIRAISREQGGNVPLQIVGSDDREPELGGRRVLSISIVSNNGQVDSYLHTIGRLVDRRLLSTIRGHCLKGPRKLCYSTQSENPARSTDNDKFSERFTAFSYLMGHWLLGLDCVVQQIQRRWSPPYPCHLHGDANKVARGNPIFGNVADPDEIEVVPEERTTAMGPRGGYGVHDRVDMPGH
ncbi:hypothetical protein EDD16DRAFT_1729254 [Pisolithus croceorrhizus]|nr:hypothetical protein EDD16DRAFT_1729254 [Pisolithus croceorrhizus]